MNDANVLQLPPERPALARAGVTLALGLLIGVLIILHTPWLNGPPFFPWPWRVLPPVQTYAALALGAAPVFAALWLYHRFRKPALALAVVVAGCFGLKLVSVLPYTDPPSLEMIRVIVEDRDTTSYYTDAAALNSAHPRVREWLELYPRYMPQLSLHSKTKAPGPILYWTAVIDLFGVGPAAAMAGGIALGALATLSIVATYLLIKSLTGERDAAFHGAAFLSLCPGFVLFFPMMDPVFPVLSCALVICWAKAVDRDDWWWSVTLGIALALTCLVSFNVLVIGAFMALYPLVVLEGPLTRRLRVIFKQGAIAAVVAVALLLALQPAIGYDAPATFASAWRNQHALLEKYAHDRPYPHTIPFDLTDFALGSGWVSVALVGSFLARRRDENEPRMRRLVLLCVAQFVIVAATGLLQTETARVWNFMLPLLMIPVGLELRRWSLTGRLIAFAGLWFVLATTAQNVRFLF